MKKVIVLFAALIVSASAFAQTTVSDKIIKATVGLGGATGIPVGVVYEQGVAALDNGSFFTIGGYAGFGMESDRYSEYTWNRSQFSLAVQGNYYLLPLVDKLDLYAGLRIGYNGIKSVYVYETEKVDYDWGSPFAYSIHIGANYWLNEKWAVNAELGYGLAALSVGVAYKF